MMRSLFALFLLLMSSLSQAYTAGTYSIHGIAGTATVYTATDPQTLCNDPVMLAAVYSAYSMSIPSETVSGDGATFACNFLWYTPQRAVDLNQLGAIYSFVGAAPVCVSPQVLQNNVCVIPAPAPASSVPASGTLTGNVDALTAAINAFNAVMQSLFTMPTSAQFAQGWMIGFGIPMILYLVSWGFGSVVNMFRSSDRHID